MEGLQNVDVSDPYPPNFADQLFPIDVCSCGLRAKSATPIFVHRSPSRLARWRNCSAFSALAAPARTC